MNGCSDSFWSMKLPKFSNTPLHIFFWMRPVFAEGTWGRAVSAEVWSPLEEKEKVCGSMAGPAGNGSAGQGASFWQILTDHPCNPPTTKTWSYKPSTVQNVQYSKINGHRFLTKCKRKSRRKKTPYHGFSPSSIIKQQPNI